MRMQIQRVIRPLKARSAPMDEWIREITDLVSQEHHANIIKQAVAKGLQY